MWSGRHTRRWKGVGACQVGHVEPCGRVSTVRPFGRVAPFGRVEPGDCVSTSRPSGRVGPFGCVVV